MGTGGRMARSGSGRSTALATSSSSGVPNSVRGRARVGKVRCPGIWLSKRSHWKSCRGGSFSNGSGRTSSSIDANLRSRRFPCWFRLQVLRRNGATARPPAKSGRVLPSLAAGLPVAGNPTRRTSVRPGPPGRHVPGPTGGRCGLSASG